MKKKKLVIFEINECDLNFFFLGSKKYNYPLIKNFFEKKKKIQTFTRDKKEGLNLDPWVQWVSIHTGIASYKHKVYRIGQKLDKKIVQIWEKLSKKNYKSTLWGLFNSNLKSKKNIDLYFPDPWSFTQKAHPKKYKNFLELPRYYAINYPDIKLTRFVYYLFLFFKDVIFSKTFFYIIKNIHKFIFIFCRVGTKSFNLYFFLDLISLDIVLNHLKNKNSDFSIIALNSFAHYQHNFWDNKKYEKYYFWYLNEMIKKIIEIDNKYVSSIFFNGFSQKKIKVRYHLRPKEPGEFLKIFKIKYKKIKPNMTTGAQVFFNNRRDKINCIKILQEINLKKKFFFEIQNFEKSNKIFFKFNIYLKQNNNIIKVQNIDKIYKDLGVFNKIKNPNIKSSDKSIITNILDGVIPGKSTSEHVSKGILYYKNFKINKNRIENVELFNYILKHFN